MLTAHGSVPTAVEAMRLGATDFLLKPFDAEEVVYVIRKAIAKGAHLAARVGSSSVARSGSVGRSTAMQEVDEIIDRVAKSGSTVLVLGESGTGKELVADAIHERSKRKGPIRQGPLRRASGSAPRERAVRSREGGLHRRAEAQTGPSSSSRTAGRSSSTRSATCRSRSR